MSQYVLVIGIAVVVLVGLGWAVVSAVRRRPVLETAAGVGLVCALSWALVALLYVAAFGLTAADLAHQSEASIVFPGARVEREIARDASFDLLFSGRTPARFGHVFSTAAPVSDVVAFYREEFGSRGWSTLVGLSAYDACARGLLFSLARTGETTFEAEIYPFTYSFPPECARGAAPPPEVVALVAVVAFTIYIVRASLIQHHARHTRGDPLRAASGVARWAPAFASVPYLMLDWRPGPTIAPSELIVDVGLVLIVAGAAFALWAASTLGVQFDLEPEVHRGHRVVRSGPYRFVRHPVYVGLAVHLVGACIASGNLALAIGVLFVGFPLFYLRAQAEEQLLRAELGSAYDAYAREVGMFLPRLTRGGG